MHLRPWEFATVVDRLKNYQPRRCRGFADHLNGTSPPTPSGASFVAFSDRQDPARKALLSSRRRRAESAGHLRFSPQETLGLPRSGVLIKVTHDLALKLPVLMSTTPCTPNAYREPLARRTLAVTSGERPHPRGATPPARPGNSDCPRPSMA